MDFSKIKKIFYILAIISMLLSIKSKVFASIISPSLLSPDDIDMPSWLDDYNWNISFFDNGGGYIGYRLFITDLNNKVLLEDLNSTSYSIRLQGVKSYKYLSGSRTNANLITYLQNLTEQTLSSQTASDGATYIGIEKSYISNNNFYTNSSLYSYTSSDTEIIPPNAITFIAPSFDNIAEIENGNPDGVFISPGDFTNTDNLYFHLLEITTGLSNSDTSIYYYSDKTIKLNKDSNYYRTWYDPSIEGFYYYIPRYKLGLSQNTSYLYVLNNSKSQINNSYGLYSIDIANGIYAVVQSDTAGVITSTEEQTDRMKNIEQSLINNQETITNINDSLTNSTINEETNSNIDTNMDFNTNAPTFNYVYGNYFSELTSIISNLGSYDLSTVETINLPIPFTQDFIPLKSNMVSQYIPQILFNIFTTFWLFIFGKYFLAYILYIYRLIASGHILDHISTDNEVITNDVL